MRTLFLVLITYVAIPATTTAQYIIKGNITGNTGKAISYADIFLQNRKDSAVVKSARSDKEDHYSLSSQIIENTMIKVEAIGYQAMTKNITDTAKISVMNFYLVPEKALTEVTVTTSKPLIEEKADRTIFNVENSVSAAGSDALEAIKKAPGVLIVHNEITIAGKDAMSVMINGRLQQLSGDDLIQFLRSIPADNLSRIEVITIPPARYDAEGNAGIINLITKKNMKQGLRGSATASYIQNSYSSPTVGTSLNYNRGGLSAYCNAYTGIYAWKYTSRTTTYYPGQTWDQSVVQGSYNRNIRIQVGADYTLNKVSTIGFSYIKGFSNIENDQQVQSKSIDINNNIDSLVRTAGVEHLRYNRNTVNVNYECRIDTTGEKLNVDADYYIQTTNKNRYYNVTDLRADGTLTGIVNNDRMLGAPSITVRSVKADVEWPLKIAKLSFGGKVAFVNNISTSDQAVLQGTEYVTEPTLSDAFTYAEATQALYISGQRSLGKIEIQAGLRGEHTQTQVNSISTGQPANNEYTQLFPTGYIQYTPREGHSFNISFNRRINRPGYSLLDPYRFYYTPTSYVEGNPKLQPSFNNGVELGYRYRSMFSFKIYARQTDHYWDRIFHIDSTAGTSEITRANIGTADYLGVHCTISVKPTKWWDLNIGANGEYATFKLNYYNSLTFNGYSARSDIDNSFSLNKSKTLLAELNGYYYTPWQKDYKVWAEMSCINMGIKMLLLNKDLILAFNIDDLLSTTYWLQTNLSNGTREYSYDDEHNVHVSVTYKFGNKNVKTRHEKNVTEEIQRAN